MYTTSLTAARQSAAKAQAPSPWPSHGVFVQHCTFWGPGQRFWGWDWPPPEAQEPVVRHIPSRPLGAWHFSYSPNAMPVRAERMVKLKSFIVIFIRFRILKRNDGQIDVERTGYAFIVVWWLMYDFKLRVLFCCTHTWLQADALERRSLKNLRHLNYKSVLSKHGLRCVEKWVVVLEAFDGTM